MGLASREHNVNGTVSIFNRGTDETNGYSREASLLTHVRKGDRACSVW